VIETVTVTVAMVIGADGIVREEIAIVTATVTVTAVDAIAMMNASGVGAIAIGLQEAGAEGATLEIGKPHQNMLQAALSLPQLLQLVATTARG